MRLVAFAILLAVSNTACAGPNVTICASDPLAYGLWCSLRSGLKCTAPFEERVNKDGEVACFINYSGTENYIAMPPADYRALLEYAKRKCKQ